MIPDSPEPMLQFFAYDDHVRDDLRVTAEAFYQLAEEVVATLPRNPERTVCLRKLLEAKDAAVRAKIYHP